MSTLPNIAEDVAVVALIRMALEEDLDSAGDVTTSSLVPEEVRGTGHILARHSCVVSGADVAAAVFSQVESSLQVTILVPDGARAAKNDRIIEIAGPAGAILTAERTALNFMQRMTGIATLTAEFVAKAGDLMILDTRKTTPALRTFEKYAVLCGGGVNHRYGLFDRVLIKDNHRKLWGRAGLGEAVMAARKRCPDLEIEIEVESIPELTDALTGSPDWILLDNMTSDLMKECVRIADGRCKLEASGGIGIDRVEEIAATGVDAVSLGCLTHSAAAADLSLELAQE